MANIHFASATPHAKCNYMTLDLDIWQVGSSTTDLGQVQMSLTWVKFVATGGDMASEGFLVLSLWPPYPYVIGQAIIFLPCGFFLLLLSSFFFSSPNLSGRRLDVYHTSTHRVALVRI